MSAFIANIVGSAKKAFTPSKASDPLNPNRVLYLDFIKFLAAFLTVFYHLAYYNLDYGFTAGQAYMPNLSRIVMCISSCCVPLFFLVNGSLMFSRQRSIKDIYLKALKIAFLTLLWSFLDFPSWFFNTLCVLYLLFPLFQLIKTKSQKLYNLICLLVFLLPFVYNFAVIFLKLFSVGNIELFGITLPLGALSRTGLATMYSILYFLLGPILRTSKKSPLLVDLLLIFGGLGLVVFECVAYTNINGAMFDGVNASFPTVGALFLSTGVFLLSKKFSFKSLAKPLLFVGSGIFAIYISHSFIINHIPFPYKESLIVSLIVALLICIVGAAIGKFASKIPFVCWLFKI